MDTFSRDLQLAALDDLDGLGGLVARLGLGVLDLLNDLIALKNLAKDNVSAIEPPVCNRCVSNEDARRGRQKIKSGAGFLSRSRSGGQKRTR